MGVTRGWSVGIRNSEEHKGGGRTGAWETGNREQFPRAEPLFPMASTGTTGQGSRGMQYGGGQGGGQGVGAARPSHRGAPPGIYHFSIPVRPIRADISIDHLERLASYYGLYGARKCSGLLLWPPLIVIDFSPFLKRIGVVFPLLVGAFSFPLRSVVYSRHLEGP